MKSYVALLRGINVGGKNSLPMKELTALLEDLGCSSVKTYIQSGNAVFRSASRPSAQLAQEISREIQARHGFEPRVLLLEGEDLERAIAANPFPAAENDPKSLHVGFLETEPKSPDLERLDNIKKDSERFQLIGRAFYLHAPEGIGRSKLAASAERLLGVAMTSRNWRTVRKLGEMLEALDG